MKKVLFIDRDGTLVIEPPEDYQLDSLEKLEFYPGVFRYLGKIATELDYELVMVTNQDGLGTDSFPEDSFWPAHNKMLRAFENEGITYRACELTKSDLYLNLEPRINTVQIELPDDEHARCRARDLLRNIQIA